MVDERLERANARLDIINGDIKEVREILAKMSLDLAVVKTKVALWASFGSLAGGAVASLLVLRLSNGG